MDIGAQRIPSPVVSNLAAAFGIRGPDSNLQYLDLETLRAAIDVGYYLAVSKQIVHQNSTSLTPANGAQLVLEETITSPGKLIGVNVAFANTGADVAKFEGCTLSAKLPIGSSPLNPLLLATFKRTPAANPGGVYGWTQVTIDGTAYAFLKPDLFEFGQIVMPGWTLQFNMTANALFTGLLYVGYSIMTTSGEGEPRVK